MTTIVDGTTGITFPSTISGVSATQQYSGRVLQVVQGTLVDGFATSSSSFVSTGLTASITPTSSSSKVLVLVSLSNNRVSATGVTLQATIYRNSTNIAGSGSGTFKNFCNMYGGGTDEFQVNAHISILDNPSTTSATSYTVYLASYNGSGTVNINWNGQTSYIQLLEIAA
jgi:hypothetical protein